MVWLPVGGSVRGPDGLDLVLLALGDRLVIMANEYPKNWKEIASNIKTKRNWQCERCGHRHNPATGYTLTVHYLIEDKSLCEEWNLVALCQRCHLRVQSKQIFPAFTQKVFNFFEVADWLKPHYKGYLKYIKTQKYASMEMR